MCANLYEANSAVHGNEVPYFIRNDLVVGDGNNEIASPPGEPEYWYPEQCYPMDMHRQPQLTADQWRSLVVRSPEELRLAAAEHRLPEGVNTQAQHDLAFWIMTRIVCDEKTLDTRDDQVSFHRSCRNMHLYVHIANK